MMMKIELTLNELKKLNSLEIFISYSSIVFKPSSIPMSKLK